MKKNEEWVSNEITWGHPHDFEVKYKFLKKETQENKFYTACQGHSLDFWYYHEDHANKNELIFRIWPEFTDGHGAIITNRDTPVPNIGFARMWIFDPEWRSYHKSRIKVGSKGYFMAGLRKIAECEVIKIVGLQTNPSVEFELDCDKNFKSVNIENLEKSMTDNWGGFLKKKKK